MSRTIVCVDCGHMGTTAPVEYAAPQGAAIEGDNEFAVKMVTQMGFVYLGCPACKSPNVFLQPVEASSCVTEAPVKTTDDEEIDVSDMVYEDEEPEPPKPVKKKKKKKVRTRRRIDADGEMQTESVEDTSVDTDDGIEDIAFKRGDPVPRKMYHRECKTPGCSKDFTTKHSHIGYCPRCLKGFTGR